MASRRRSSALSEPIVFARFELKLTGNCSLYILTQSQGRPAMLGNLLAATRTWRISRAKGAHLCRMVAAERDQQLVPCWRRVQALHVVLRPLQ